MIAPVALVLFWPAALWADYTIVLKSGRRITVQTYREEGRMIKAYGLGGEIGIPKDQIQSILKAGEEGRGMDLRSAESTEAGPAELRQEEEKQPPTQVEGAPPGDKLAEERAKEEKEYQKRVKEITEQIKAATQRYSVAGRGGSTPEEALLGNEGAIRARADDLNARLRDQQHNPAGPSDAGGVKLSTPSPFTGQPPSTIELSPGEVAPRANSPAPTYSEREREFSELRNRINQLVKERERLIEEMRQKNFETGNLFLD